MAELIRSPIPLYYQLQNIIREKIKNREFPPSSKIPSEYDLCREYNVSRQTVRHALKNLADEGLINAIAGKGYFVGPTKKWFQSEWLVGSLDDLLALRKKAHYELLGSDQVDIEKNDHIAKRLKLNKREKVTRFKGIWSVGKDYINFTVMYIPNYIPKKLGFRYGLDRFEDGHSMAFNEALDHVWEARQYTIATLADKELSKYLKMSEGEPVLLLERVYISKEEEPLMFAQLHYPTAFYTHILRLKRAG